MKYRSDILNKARVEATKDNSVNKVSALLTLLFLTIIGFAFILPASRSVRIAVDKNQELTKTKESLMRINKQYEQSAVYLEESSPYKNQILNLIPTNPEPAELVGAVTLYSTKNSLEFANLRSISSSDSVDGRGKGLEDSFSLNLKGTYRNISKFFSDFSNDKRYYKIERLSINIDPEEEGGDKLVLSVNLKAFKNEQ